MIRLERFSEVAMVIFIKCVNRMDQRLSQGVLPTYYAHDIYLLYGPYSPEEPITTCPKHTRLRIIVLVVAIF